jgi:hypothetical protein
LRGDDIQSVDWTSDVGNKIVRRQFYFQHRSLVSVTETIHVKGNRHTGEWKHPRLLSMTKFGLDDPDNERRGEFLQQARRLVNEFRAHRASFHPCGAAP